MTVLIDMDDVIEQLVIGWVTYLNRKYSLAVSPENVRDWDMSAAFPALTREQVYDALNDDALWDDVRPMPGAQEVLKRLTEDGHELYIVTATNYQTLRAKMEKVLFRYFPFIPWERVIITRNKQMIRGDVLVDDGPHNFAGGVYRGILFDAGHNRSFDERSVGAVRVRGWEEAYREIARIARER